ncbi:MAG: insulinase family protein [Alphaproteobacteria bacterium]|nr:insulinase family protein [Alphaproteobacteria bacterium]
MVINHNIPVVTQMIVYKVGSVDEPLGKSGLAHFLEHLMFKGTKNTPPGLFSKEVELHGGQENAFTTQDYTSFYQTIARDNLERIIALEADRMTNLSLLPKDLEFERQVVLEERNQRIENQPQARLKQMMQSSLFLNHPYGRPIIGWEHEIKNLDLKDINNFYHSWYAPNNAILVLTGDFDEQQTRKWINKYYGPIKPKNLPTKLRLQEPPREGIETLSLTDPQIQTPSWRREYLISFLSSSDKKSKPIFQLFSEIMGGGETSRLYKNIVIDQKIATSVGCYFYSYKDYAQLGFYGQPSNGHTIDEVIQAIDATIDQFLNEGISEAELISAKNLFLAESIKIRDDLNAPSNIIGVALATGQTIDDIENWAETIEAVQLADIQKLLKPILKRENSVSGLLFPQSQPSNSSLGSSH